MSKKGFTLIEIITVIGIIILFCGFSIMTISSIPQTRMKKFAQDIRYNFELARDFSKTHGGTISLSIVKTEDGLELVRDVRKSSKHDDYTMKSETITLSDSKVELFYKETNVYEENRLGESDNKEKLEFQFSQTDGRIIGPDYIDYIIISNGSKTYKLIIMQSSGQIYFDYELEEQYVEQNEGATVQKVKVETPCFVKGNVKFTTPCHVEKSDELSTVQPPIQYDSRYVKISGVYRASNPSASGLYTIYFDLKDPYSCQWNTDNSLELTTTKILQWDIASAE